VIASRTCPYCEAAFTPRWVNQVFCQRKHRERMSRARRTPADRCDGKVPYGDEPAAAVALAETRAVSSTPERLGVYQCPAGGHWHVGHDRLPGRQRGAP
jgi:hypothetical protein